MDLIDLHVEVPSLKRKEISGTESSETSEAIQERVYKAREIQQKRFEGQGVNCNAQMTSSQLRRYCLLDDPSQTLLKNAMEKFGLSARAYDRILKAARTITDLDTEANVKSSYIAEAVFNTPIWTGAFGGTTWVYLPRA